MNPCPCGHLGDTLKQCSDSDVAVQRYIGRLSGPILDRIDMHLEVPRLSSQELLSNAPAAETSSKIRERVIAARKRQLARFTGLNTFSNAEMSPVHLKQFCKLDAPSHELMKKAMQRLHLSARAFDRVLQLAITIADLAQSDNITSAHLAEALQYRALEKLYKTSNPVPTATVSRLPQSMVPPSQKIAN
jgi:magnesium chelatase family protein